MKNTFKHILTAVAAIALSIPAFAQEQDWSAIKTNKTATYDAANDKVDITLETFVNGYRSNIWTPATDAVEVPLDIVLVLDVSGSMDGKISAAGTGWTYLKSNDKISTVINKYTEKEYYIKNSNGYERVTSVTTGRFIITWWAVNGNIVSSNQTFYEHVYIDPNTKVEMTKLDALKAACESFINTIAFESEAGMHKISIVKFAGDEKESIGNDTYRSGLNRYNNTQIVKVLTDSDNTDELINAVNSFTEGGATSADYGLNRAYEALKSSRENSKKIVLLFTDGEPTHGSSFNTTVAGDAIMNAAKLKKDYNAAIYTVGVFDDSVSSNSNVNKYMNAVSSNYPDAENWTTIGNQAKDDNDVLITKYYKTARNGAELADIFETIAGEEAQNTGKGSSKGAGVNLGGEDTSVTLKDIVTTNFVIPQTNGVPTDITLKLIPAVSVSVNEEIAHRNDSTHAPAYNSYVIGWEPDPTKWETITPAEGQVTVDNNTLNVDGKIFDFSANWIGVEEKWTVNKSTPDEVAQKLGKKLVISFSVKPDPTKAGGKVETNTKDSGVYVEGENVTPGNKAEYDVPKPVFVPANITIRKSGMLPGESAIFEVTATNEAGTYTKNYTVAMTANESGEMKDAVIMRVPIVTNPNAEANGEDLDWISYTVKETSWSWAYTSDQPSITRTMTNDPATHLFEFKNTPKTETPKHGESNANNIFAK